MDSYSTPARVYVGGQGQAVADRSVNRITPEGKRETWAQVAERVALGNAMLSPDKLEILSEFHELHHHLRQASILMSGRHLQHGDPSQGDRNQEVFTNCSTAAASFSGFYLLLNGSGVGRSYDDHMMVLDYRNMPNLFVAVDADYPDRAKGFIPENTPRAIDLIEDFDETGRDFICHIVEDSREGWAHAVELVETLSFEGDNRDLNLILDFSDVRPHGSPIRGMQNRPSSGPAPTMAALQQVATLRDKPDMAPWEQAMHVDHYMAESVLVGGARRAARMATKSWRDETIFGFINIKRDGGLWSSNNSVTVDEEFWKLVGASNEDLAYESEATVILAAHAKMVFEAVCQASYFDGTGEPGLINADKLTAKNENLDVFDDGDYMESDRFQLIWAKPLAKALAEQFKTSHYKMITNPCGEIPLIMLGGYCVIADVVPYHAQDLLDAEQAFRVTTRALIRTNLMNCLYQKEVKRTNRIGVGITGLHEFAWKFFGYGFRDLIDETKSMNFWLTLSRFKRAVVDEAASYSDLLGVARPHTNTTMKPAGTTSKLFGLTEAAHLPPMLEYLRYVQFRNDDPLVGQYRAAGYPTQDLVSYPGTTIVGFPTEPVICSLGMGDKLVTAAQATPEEQYQWLRLLEKYWIRGVEQDGVTPLRESGNQVSYTLKYDPKLVSFEDFKRTLFNGQRSVRCCSVMPQIDTTAYEYQPETPVSAEEFKRLVRQIEQAGMGIREDIGREHVDCGGGACPIDFEEGALAAAPEEVIPPKVSRWVIFGSSSCQWCASAKSKLEDNGIDYEYVDIGGAGGLEFLRQYTHARSIPQIVFDGKLIGNFHDLDAFIGSHGNPADLR